MVLYHPDSTRNTTVDGRGRQYRNSELRRMGIIFDNTQTTRDIRNFVVTRSKMTFLAILENILPLQNPFSYNVYLVGLRGKMHASQPIYGHSITHRTKLFRTTMLGTKLSNADSMGQFCPTCDSLKFLMQL